MIKNYLLIAVRNLLRQSGFSLINISGLAIGMCSAVLIFLWIGNEISYDQFHEKKDYLFRAWNRAKFDGKLQCWNNTPKILAPTLKEEFPEIKSTSRMGQAFGLLFTVGETKLTPNGFFVDPEFISMFSFPLVKGNAGKAFKDVYSVLLTEKLAKKIFGDEEPMGKTIKINNSDAVVVTGILKDLPNHTSFDFEYLMPWSYMKKLGWDDDYWGNNSTSTLVELNPGVSIDVVQKKIKDIAIRHSKGELNNEVFLHPISKWRLYSKFEDGINVGGRIEVIRLFGLIAALILLIACINFMNLSTARSEKRAKEVGIRKVVGAQRKSLVGQFLGESVLIAFIAGIIALCLVQLILPLFNELTKKVLILPLNNVYFWLAGISFILITGIIAGSYPAFYLSAFRPVSVLKGTFRAMNALITPRKFLVVLQFTIAIILIVSTLIIYKQLEYTQQREAGYSKDNLIFSFLTGDLEKNFVSIRNELLTSGVATSVTKTSAPLTEGWSNSWGFEWEGKDPNTKIIFDRFCADANLAKTAGLTIVQGRDMDVTTYVTDSSACLVNESAVKAMGFKNPIGQIIKDNGKEWHVVGVIRDFILQSPSDPTAPMVIEGAKAWFNVVHIKLNKNQTISANMNEAEKIFKNYNPLYPFEYTFVDQEYQQKFNDIKLTGKLSALFAFLTILISCLGLFGLSAYMAENKVKEIGIRKVMGASVGGIVTMLSKEFIKLVLFSLAVSAPIAWYVMSQWLETIPYRITLDVWIFISAGALAIFIALVTVSFQSIKAAMGNPVDSLRSE